jgi:hypothetical protein
VPLAYRKKLFKIAAPKEASRQDNNSLRHTPYTRNPQRASQTGNKYMDINIKTYAFFLQNPRDFFVEKLKFYLS